MNTLIHKTDQLKSYSSLVYFFDMEELTILTEMLEVIHCQKGQIINRDCPVLIVSNQSASNHKQARAAFNLEQPTQEKGLNITTKADGICFTLEKNNLQGLLEKHPFLAIKLNQIVDTQLTSLVLATN